MLDSAISEQPAAEAGVDRRSLMGRIGAGAASAAAIGALAAGGLATTSVPAQAQGVTDADILNFALNLEYLEAEFYLRAFLGTGLPDSLRTGTGTPGAVTGGSRVPFKSPAIASYAQVLASDENAHVQFFRAALGSAAVAAPAIDFATSFTTLARAAGLINATQTFNPFADDVSFLIGAYVFEDVGVTAFAGAARLLTNKDFLEAAAGVLAVEAYHAGAIRGLLANIGGGAVANAISAARAQASGVDDDVGIIVPGNNYNFTNTDSQGLAHRRTTRQVLNIVYIGTPPGGFFPAGLNGTIR